LIIVSVALLFIGVNAYAEQQAPRMVFKHVLQDQLASIGYVTTIAQDLQGFMWFGGANGLARYDGYTLIIFRHEDANPNSISHSHINHITLGRDGALWIATRNGINLYDANQHNFKHFQVSADAGDNDVNWLQEDRKGHFWLGTRAGFFRFDPAQNAAWKIEDKTHAAIPDASQSIWSIVDDSEGNIWLASQTYGVSRYDPVNERFEYFTRPVNEPNAYGFNDTRRLYIDNENNLMAATYGDGLYRFDKTERQFVKINHDTSEKGATVWAMLVDRHDNLWVGDGSHLHLRPAQQQDFFSYAYSDADSTSPGNYVVNDVFEDRAGDIWVGYFPSGVDLVDPMASAFQNYTHASNNANSITDGGVSSAIEDHAGNFWIGTGYGLNYVDRTRNQVTRFVYEPSNPNGLSGSTILSIVESSEHNLWLGIWSGGLNFYNPKSGEFTHYLPDGGPHSLHGREVWSVIEDSQHNLWLATEEGLNKFDTSTKQFEYFLPPPEFLGGEKVLYSHIVYEDHQKNLWLGSMHGLYLFDRTTKRFTRYQHNPADDTSLSADFVLSIYEDAHRNLWIGTEGGGLSLLDRTTGKFVTYTMKDGLVDNVIGSIVADEKGNLWLGTQKGIACFDVEKRSFRTYDKHHGLADNLYNRNAALLTHNNEILMGHSKGFTLFKPEQLKLNEFTPNVVITSLELGNKPVSIGAPDSPLSKSIEAITSLQLDYHTAVFSLEFAALSYHHVEDNQYAYRLSGFEENWNYVGKRHSATYTNLSPGTYIFEVKGANNDGLWSPYPATLQIEMLPPYWRTWWAYSIYFLIILGLGYWFFHMYRLKLLYQAEKLEQERIINKRLTQIDRLKDEFLANTSHELRTPLNGIIGLAESLAEGIAGEVSPKMKHHLALIIESGKRLSNLVNDILDFSKLKNRGLTLYKKNIDLRVLVDVVFTLSKPSIEKKPVVFVNNVPKSFLSVFADEDRVLQILHNLIGNAVKFTDRGVISVGAKVINDVVHIEVGDTGMGIPGDRIGEIFESFTQLEGGASRMQAGAGLGLSVAKQLVELHGGSIRVESVLGIGSTFIFTLPISYDLPEKIHSKHMADVVNRLSGHNIRIEPESSQLPLSSTKSTVLIVDDDSINRKVIANFLSMGGYHIVEADCAEDAFAIVANQPIDLVLLDIMMPRISGYDACKSLRQKFPAHELPIILLTARSQINDLVMGFEAGANDFMVKPIAKEALLVRVATHLQLHDVTRNLDKKVAERTDELNKSNAVLKVAQEELEEAYKKLEAASLTDPLTELNNRRFLNQSIEGDIAIVERNYQNWFNNQLYTDLKLPYPYEQDLMFMMLDIDYFKIVNDTYGHSAGDKLLHQLGQLLKNILRESDYLIRWGGEEFLIVVRYCNREEVTDLAERIRQKVAENIFDLGNDQHIHKTCSIGMAAFPFCRSAPSTITWEQVIDTADKALYLAKDKGRNCWVNIVSNDNQSAGLLNPAVGENLATLVEQNIVTLEFSPSF